MLLRADINYATLQSLRPVPACAAARLVLTMNNAQRTVNRLSADRRNQAFTFWYRRQYGDRHVGAWMLERDEHQARFITSAEQAPRVGETLELTEPVDAAAAGSPTAHLPRYGRVIGLDNLGQTRRVAIRFEPPRGRFSIASTRPSGRA